MNSSLSKKVKIIALSIVVAVSLCLIVAGIIMSASDKPNNQGDSIVIGKEYEVSSYNGMTRRYNLYTYSSNANYKVYVTGASISIYDEDNYSVSKNHQTNTQFNGVYYDACYKINLSEFTNYSFRFAPEDDEFSFVVIKMYN